MKKLLSILGAVGMTAVAGTAVVACTNENTKGDNTNEQEKSVIDISRITSSEKYDLGWAKDEQDAINKMWEVLSPYPGLNNENLVIDTHLKNELMVYGKNDKEIIGQMNFTYSLAFDLSKVKFMFYDMGADKRWDNADADLVVRVWEGIHRYAKDRVTQTSKSDLKYGIDYKLEGMSQIQPGRLTGKMFEIKIVSASEKTSNTVSMFVTFGKL